MATVNDKAKKIVEAIERDLCDRRGLRHAFDEIDDDIKEEIRDRWQALAFEILTEL